jgi:sialate O-acetylesterase
MHKSLIYILLFTSFLFGISCQSDQELTPVHLPQFFGDHMVLQRDQPIRFWGDGVPGKKVVGKMNGKQVETRIDTDGNWLLEFEALPASGPYEVNINGTVFNDVQVGDVWVAGGQSNMEWVMGGNVEGSQKELVDADYNLIRFFKIPHDYDAKEKPDVRGGTWIIANAENLLDFSAVAWFFAKQLHLEKGVPVGIIESNWGGTPAEGWTSTEKLLNHPFYGEKAKDMLDRKEYWTEEVVQNKLRELRRNDLVSSPQNGEIQGAANPNYDDSAWKTIQLPNDNPFEHIAWFRKKINIPQPENMQLQLGDLQQMAHIYLNGGRLWHKVAGNEATEIPVPSSMLVSGENTLVIRLINTWNNAPVIGKKGSMFLKSDKQTINLEGSWKYSNTVEEEIPKVEWYNWNPGFMYNAMIAPIIKYPIKGVIWYQGESNAGQHQHYRSLFSTMIQDWREKWAIGDFPFLFVQLANFMERKTIQPESNWAFLREAQTQVLELPNTGMAVTIDIGDANDIHPRNKRDVGLRLWQAARKVAYGENGVVWSGPVAKNFAFEDEKVVITFDETGSGLKTSDGQAVKGFVLEDASGQFFPARAEITSENQITVASNQPAKIDGVRYAWADNPEVNLYNSEGLPAIPFRSNR